MPGKYRTPTEYARRYYGGEIADDFDFYDDIPIYDYPEVIIEWISSGVLNHLRQQQQNDTLLYSTFKDLWLHRCRNALGKFRPPHQNLDDKAFQALMAQKTKGVKARKTFFIENNARIRSAYNEIVDVAKANTTELVNSYKTEDVIKTWYKTWIDTYRKERQAIITSKAKATKAANKAKFEKEFRYKPEYKPWRDMKEKNQKAAATQAAETRIRKRDNLGPKELPRKKKK